MRLARLGSGLSDGQKNDWLWFKASWDEAMLAEYGGYEWPTIFAGFMQGVLDDERTNSFSDFVYKETLRVIIPRSCCFICARILTAVTVVLPRFRILTAVAVTLRHSLRPTVVLCRSRGSGYFCSGATPSDFPGMLSEHFINTVMGITAWSSDRFLYHASERFVVIWSAIH